ncbi:MAG: cation:proton antiporter [Bacteroidales bacterium]|nr:cation:proton antiporter [Bacteroidales bacterium]
MHHFSFPLKEPLIIFTVVLFIVLIIPVFLRKTKIPGIVGLILAGIIIGPHATNFIAENDTIELFSKVGLLYIMFLAGLEIEFVEFKKNSLKAIFFGIATFVFPFLFGYYSGKLFLNLDDIPSVLIGIMLASNTLIAFPIISKLGVSKTPSVITAISGTVIADTIVLIILAIITALIGKNQGGDHLTIFFVSFASFIFVVFFLLPKLSLWFFKTVANDGNLQYLYALCVLFAASFTAELIGAEAIIGAFFAGLAINRLIPSNSALMNRIDFVGNTLFIPFFLISVGMLVNLEVIFSTHEPALYAALLIVLGISGKWVAAFLTKLLFKQSKTEMNVIFGLTTARAAATLAIALVGLNYGVLSKDIFNGTIILILFSSMFSSYITEKYGKKLVLDEEEKIPEISSLPSNRILVPIANPKSVENLIDFAILIHDKKSHEPIYPLAIVKDDQAAEQHIISNKTVIDKIKKQAAASNISVKGITRIDINVPTAIARTTKELHITDLILGWSGKASNEIIKMFENMLESLLNNTDVNLLICKFIKPINLSAKMIVFIPKNAEKEKGFAAWINILVRLCKQTGKPVIFYSFTNHQSNLESILKKEFKGFSAKYFQLEKNHDVDDVIIGNKDACFIFINSRKQTISYNSMFYTLTYRTPDILMESNVVNIYPHHHY